MQASDGSSTRSIIREPLAFWLGLAAIAVGLAGHPAVWARLLTGDGRITTPDYLLLIRLFQVGAVAAGASLAIWQPDLGRLANSQKAQTATALGLVCLLGVGELGARFWLDSLATQAQISEYGLYTEIPQRQQQNARHQYLNYYPTPSFTRGATRHNALGFRGPEITIPKPPGVYRIAVLGGSPVYGTAMRDDSRTFPAQLEQVLRERHGSDRIEVVNAGAPSYTSWESLVNLEFRVLDVEPDLLIVYLDSNDVHARLVEPSAYRGDNSGLRQPWQGPPIPLWERSALLRIISRRLRRTLQVGLDQFIEAPTGFSRPLGDPAHVHDRGLPDPFDLLDKNPPVYFRRNVTNIVAVARANGAEVLLATWASSPRLGDYASFPHYQRGFEEHNALVRQVAAERGVPVFDFAAVMPEEPAFWADGRHVNEQGARLQSELFARFIESARLIPNASQQEPN